MQRDEHSGKQLKIPLQVLSHTAFNASSTCVVTVPSEPTLINF